MCVFALYANAHRLSSPNQILQQSFIWLTKGHRRCLVSGSSAVYGYMGHSAFKKQRMPSWQEVQTICSVVSLWAVCKNISASVYFLNVTGVGVSLTIYNRSDDHRKSQKSSPSQKKIWERCKNLKFLLTSTRQLYKKRTIKIPLTHFPSYSMPREGGLVARWH